jgi:tetratricopeptide (TPR) repeat protein
VIALVAAAGLSVGSYLLFLHEPAFADTLKHLADIAIARPADFARLTLPAEAKPRSVAAVEARADMAQPPPQDSVAPMTPEPHPAEKREAAANIPSDVIVPVAVAPPGEPGTSTASVGPPLELMPSDAHAYRERGVSAYRIGDLDGAMADFDRAIQLAPKFSAASIDRGILLYRLQKFERAFADIAHAKRIERTKNAKAETIKAESIKTESINAENAKTDNPKPDNAKAAQGGAKKPKSPQAAMVLGFPPLFQRHTAKLE